ncbi:flagellar operon protein [Clostridium aceticum]|uniref:Flagellar operon protein n=1 Tax=Clostridium aceticum TaxID=84022 RepID=A0A0D8I986_9CLOT|nr:TIGR03826 family flagellar region protein [Clostridium aceticum]AKL93767.1 flagellar operon protein [Clostridium aceticum]KJF25806.1 MerR family transcriptional regulator [Clostridium aceticum]
MDLRNCASCGRAFAYTGSDVCSRCDSTVEDDYKKVRDYLYDHPGASIIEVSEATEVTEKRILMFLRENRIEIREEDNLLLDCQRCGVAIRSGRFCDSCTIELQKELTQVVKPSKQEVEDKKKATSSENHKMYVAEIRKKNK